MKQLSKIMLATVASVALAAPAFAWDFGASGSSSAKWMTRTTNSGLEGASGITSAAFSSSAGGVSISSSNSEGPNSATLTYSLDFNSDSGALNLDESFGLSASKKVGNWTASSATTQYIQKDSNSGETMTGDGSAVITLTDGSITYKLGSTGHLSTAEKTSGGPMAGIQDAEARLDSFNGFSVGLGVGPGTLTVALDMHSGTSSVFFGEGLDGDDNASAGADTATACGSDTTGFGLNFAGDVGADLTFTYATGSSSAKPTCTGDSSSNATSMNTMGLGVAVPVGGMTIALDYESTAYAMNVQTVETSKAKSGFEISVTMPVGDATAGVNISSTSSTVTTPAGSGDAAVTAGTEVWYTVPIGPVSLSAGYGSAAVTSAAGDDTETTTEIGAEMSMSF